ncbi:MAG: DNA-3-methyladenine glycosylase [Bacteroidales bacterium]|jgi:DNA-3-methyladenine glycosylase|nr:DNA-3-methyladenine glycosylase [Bacteroidales bacterium]
MLLPKNYYFHHDVVFLAKDLVGKYLFTKIDGQLSGGIITETEAYKGVEDRACHAFGGKRTKRNEMMYAEGGVAYVYLCYGIHPLLNVVTNLKDIPDAVLIRAIHATHGEELMLKRTGKPQMNLQVTDGPGKVTKALGITLSDNGEPLQDKRIWIEDRGLEFTEAELLNTPRIGVEYAGEDALLKYRFSLPDTGIILHPSVLGT